MTDFWNDANGDEDLGAYRQASERVHRRLLFFQDLGIFAGVMLVLLAIDLVHHIFLGSEEFFVPWVAGIWGTIMAAHFIYAFFIAELLGPELERRLTEREIRRLDRIEEWP